MKNPKTEKYAAELGKELATMQKIIETKLAIAMTGKVDEFLADSTLFMEYFGLIVVGWQWLKQGQIAIEKLESGALASDKEFYEDKYHTMKFYYHYEFVKTLGLSKRLLDSEILTIFKD
jgi:butyryl-CoA dehydrogenase